MKKLIRRKYTKQTPIPAVKAKKLATFIMLDVLRNADFEYETVFKHYSRNDARRIVEHAQKIVVEFKNQLASAS